MKGIVKEIPIGCDHAGYELKEFIKENLKEEINFMDFGCYSSERVDYPDMIHPLAKSINDKVFEKGIIICGSGNGVAMVANKYINVRAALCWNEEIAKLAREHNDANIIALPARFISNEKALEILKIFLNTQFEGGRHKIRVEKISEILIK